MDTSFRAKIIPVCFVVLAAMVGLAITYIPYSTDAPRANNIPPEYAVPIADHSLRVGMCMAEVKKLIGEPAVVDSGAVQIHYYYRYPPGIGADQITIVEYQDDRLVRYGVDPSLARTQANPDSPN